MQLNCTKCNTLFNKTQSEIKKSKSGNHFCSKSCSASFNNKGVRRHGDTNKGSCLYCNLTLDGKQKLLKFCSHKCFTDSKIAKTFKQLESGENLSAKRCKRYYIDKNYACSICNLNSWQNKEISLELDHIDGDGTNNTLKNTRLLCPNCHSQTSNFKFKNSENPKGKEFRLNRYQKSIK